MIQMMLINSTLTGNSATAEVNFKAVEAPVITVAGTFTGVPDAALKGDVAVELVPDDTSLDTVNYHLQRQLMVIIHMHRNILF